ncbi:hypothetical protein Rhe02_01520 [Rhizocola hellebori]|uniref:Teneurin-1 n=1 Tax=Rhizocola hellebori TaxID=1392758 RepID=A0A8J3Q1L1_9ACTN|nr:LamG-like jellyroll fold domain-containing protein [Rhizocola hellebori]GIH02085.1 hypothetical protein Rhe02_01520 [Rhizocola hellebori]
MRSTWAVRCCAALAVILLLVLGLPIGLPPAPSGTAFPLAGIRDFFASAFAWAQDRPETPRQAHGTAGRATAVGSDATRANGGSGSAPPDVPGYKMPAEVSGVQTTPSRKGFDAATSRRIQDGASATTEVFQNADGTITRRVHSGPVNYRGSDGLWRPIDVSLRRDANGRLRTRAGGSSVEFAGAGTSAFGGGATAGQAQAGELSGADTANRLASLNLATGQSLEYGLVGAAGVEPVVSGSMATYPDILPGTDVELIAGDGQIKETVILKSAKAPTQWVFPLKLKGLTPQLQADGSVNLLDSAGAAVLAIPHGWMRDSKADAVEDGVRSDAVSYELITVGGRPALKVSADPAWIADPARVFPIRMDPTMYPVATGSTYVQTKTSDPSSCCTNNNSGSSELRVGYHSSGPWRTRSLLKFDNVGWSPPGYRIWSGQVMVSLGWSGACPTYTGSGMWVYDIASPWTPAGVTNWNNQPALGAEMGSSWGTPNSTVCNNHDPQSFNVGIWWGIPFNANGAAVLNRWTSGGTNNGVALLGDESSTSDTTWKKLSSINTNLKPYLELNYSLNAAPMIDTQYPEHGYATPTLTPELLVRGSDSDAFPLPVTYRFLVKEAVGSTFVDVADSGFSANTKWTVPAGKLSWGKTYVWTAQAWDGALASTNQSWKVLSTAVPQPPITSSLSQNGGKGFSAEIGNFTTSATDAQAASPGPALAIVRNYNTRDPRTGGMFGASWSTVLDAKATETPTTIVITYPSGQEVAFGRNPDGTTFTPPSGRFSELAAVAGGYALTDKDGTKYSFTQGTAPTFKLKSITDTNARGLALDYDGTGKLVSMTGASGRKLFFTIVNSRVTEVANDLAQKWTYTYTGSNLTKVCDPTTTTACTVYTYGPTWAYPATALNARPHTYLRLGEAAGIPGAASAVIDDFDTAAGVYQNVSQGQPGILTQSGTSAGFNGSNAHITLPQKVALTSSWQSVSMWFKTTGTGVLYSLQSASLAANPANGWNPVLYIGTDGKLRGEFYQGAGVPITTAAAVNNGNWHHVALTLSATTQDMYLDGQLIGTLTGVADIAFGTNAIIGSGKWALWPQTSGNDGYFNGSISDFAFYTRPLRAAEVTGMWDAGRVAASSLTRITRPSTGITAQVEYQAGTSVVTKVTDADNGQWTIGAPTVAGSSLPYTSAVMSGAPVDHYRLVGSAANELNGATATASAVTFGSFDGPFGAKAASFNNSYIQANSTTIDTSKSFSMSGWVYLTDKTVQRAAISFEGNRIYSALLYHDPSSDRYRFMVSQNDVDSPTTFSASALDSTALNTWTHLAGVYDKTQGKITLYVNGVPQNTVAVPSIFAAGPLSLGRFKYAGGQYGPWAGHIAEVATYRNALTAAQVEAQYAARTLDPITGQPVAVPAKTISVTGPAATGPQATTTSYIYDVLAGGRQVQQVDPLGGRTVFGYDEKGFLQSTVDANGNMTVLQRESRGNVKTSTTCQDRSENKCSTVYNSYHLGAANDPCNDQIEAVRDPRSSSDTDNAYRTAYAYDAACNRISVTDPLGRVATTAYTTTGIKGLPTTVTSPNGGTTTSTYYANGDLLQSTDAAGLATVFEYDAVGRMTKKTVKADGGDLVTTFTYDAYGRVQTQTDPAMYDRVNSSILHTKKTTTTYDLDGHTTSVKSEDLTGGDGWREVKFGYNTLGQQTTQTDAMNLVTTTEYDLSGRPVKTTKPDGVATAIAYDKNGNKITTTLVGWTGDPNNPTAAADLVTERRAYDPGGRLASVTDARNYLTTYTYTDNNLPVTVTREDGPTKFVLEANTYDAAGNPLTKTTNNGATLTSFVVDAASRKTSATLDAAGVNRTTTFSYGLDDNVITTRVSAASGQQTIEAAYDLAGRQTSKTVTAGGSGGLAGRWKLDNDTADAFGNSPATATGVTWSAERGGSAVFDGTTTQIDMAGPVLDSAQSFTISAWAKLADKASTRVIAGQWGQTRLAFNLEYSSFYDRWAMVVGSGDPGTSLVARSDVTPTLNTWTHLTGVYNAAAKTLVLYVNGVAQANSLSNITMWPSKGVFCLSCLGGSKFKGTVDDLQAYQKALTPAEILAVYNGTAPTATTAQRTSWQLDKRGLATSMTDPNGSRTYAEYDAAGRQTETKLPAVASEESGGTPVTVFRVSTIGYNTFGDQVAVKDPRGLISTFVVDANGRVTEAHKPSYTAPGSSTPIDSVAKTEYFNNGLVKKTIDPLNNATTYIYDQLGRLASTTAPDLGVSRFGYTLNGQQSSVTDPTGVRAEATYDYMERVLTSTEVVASPPASYITNYSYHVNGWLATVTPPGPGRSAITYTHNNAGDLTRVVDGAGVAVDYSYDFAARKTATKLADNSQQTLRYDDFGRVDRQQTLDPGGAVYSTVLATFDKNNNTLSVNDARTNTTTFTYDALNQLIRTIEPISSSDSITSTFGYDIAGNPTRFTDGRGYHYVTTYNTWNLPESRIEPPTNAHPNAVDRTFTIKYNAAGLAVGQTLPGGVSTTQTYDTAGRPKTTTGTGAQAATTDRVLDYDLAGRLKSASGSGGTNNFIYDGRGKLASTTGPSGASSFSYTPDGLLASCTDAAGLTSYTYDTGARLDTVTNTAAGIALDYNYNNLSQVTQITYGSNQNRRLLGYRTDGSQRLETDEVKTSGGTSLGKITYGWDKNGNLTSKNTTGFTGAATNVYTYDYANRLTSWNGASYLWDKSGNRLQAGLRNFTYDERNRLKTADGTNYAYTPRGTMLSATTGTVTLPTETDAFGRVIRQYSTGTGYSSYEYDGLDRMVRAGFKYTALGNQLAEDPTAKYVHGPAGDLLGVKPTGAGVYAWTDLHSDVVAQFGATSATFTGSTTYDPFGKTLASTGMQGSLGFQSGWSDTATGRVNMHARWYNTDTGQFDTRDTIDVSPVPASVGGNKYGYGNANPLVNVDPTGHVPMVTGSEVEEAQYLESHPAEAKVIKKIKKAARIAAIKSSMIAATPPPSSGGPGAYTIKDGACHGGFVEDSEGVGLIVCEGGVSNLDDYLTGKFTFDNEVNCGTALENQSALENWNVDKSLYTSVPYCGTVLKHGHKWSLDDYSREMFGVPFAQLGEEDKAAVLRGSYCELNPTMCGGGGETVGEVFEFLLSLVPVVGTVIDGMKCAAGERDACVWTAIGLIPLGGLAKLAKMGRLGAAIANSLGADAKALKGLEDLKISRGGAFCSFSPDTRVLMADGNSKALADVRIGDKVHASDPETGESGGRTITAVWIHDDSFVELEVDGKVVRTTEDHPFWNDTDQEWQRADELDRGDLLIAADGRRVPVTSSAVKPTTEGLAYNLTVSDLHTYYVLAGATPVLVHNSSGPCIVTPNRMSPTEAAHAKELGDYAGAGNFVGQTAPNMPGIDGWMDSIPTSLKDVTGASPTAVFRHASKAESQLRNAGYSNGIVSIRASNVSDAVMRDFIAKGNFADITTQGTVGQIFIKTDSGWIYCTNGTCA